MGLLSPLRGQEPQLHLPGPPQGTAQRWAFPGGRVSCRALAGPEAALVSIGKGRRAPDSQTASLGAKSLSLSGGSAGCLELGKEDVP